MEWEMKPKTLSVPNHKCEQCDAPMDEKGVILQDGTLLCELCIETWRSEIAVNG